MSVQEILTHINNEDKAVPYAVEKALPQIERLVAAISDKMLAGGRLFYVGAGTSGRLGILDASECPYLRRTAYHGNRYYRWWEHSDCESR